MNFPKLNFESVFDFKFRKDKDKFFIYDILRKSWILLTPEEWVRQHWIHFFVFERDYGTSALISEKKIELNGLTKRIDLLITEKTEPKILVECKAPSVYLTEKVFEQTARYNSILNTKHIILSNGLQHIFAEYDGASYLFKKRIF